MSYLDNIKLLASELASMSPRTQLEIVKLCKNLCIEVKDFLVDFTENDFAEALSRITAIEGRLDSAEDDIALHTQEIASINSSIDNIIIDLNNRYTKQEINTMLESYYTKSQVDVLLNDKADKATTYTKTEADALLDDKLYKPTITLFASGGILTTEQLNAVKDAKTAIINVEGTLYYKRQSNLSNDIIFTSIYVYSNTKTDTENREYMELYLKSVYINKNTGEWRIDNSFEHADNKFITVYDKSEIDALLADNFNLSKIVDDDGNRRFVEGDVNIYDTITGLTKTYGKWSLSGTHLMIVLGLNVDNGLTLTAPTAIGYVTLPEWIMNKISVLWGNDSVAFGTFKFIQSTVDTQDVFITLSKGSGLLVLYNRSNITFTSEKNARIQFDLLIDTD